MRGSRSGGLFSLENVWNWARRHPGTLVMGAMLLAALLAPRPKPSAVPTPEAEADETPLFI